ncbi:MAG TPA: aldo/keto reductase [Gammaproteobacteria bacterium]|nr:aldo/keto reductase [Gammaproteobacteria bacterium]|tara:strand:+ start:6533 stop:7474 length:942 start_codon:yes stop_codon:yes gene_type:complete
MQYRKLGKSDLELPIITLGALNFGFFCDEQRSISTIHAAIDNGVNCIDTAPTYGGMKGKSEDITGKAVKGIRDEVILATKFGTDPATGRSSIKGGGSRSYIIEAVENSLRSLDTDYIDLYQMHFPDTETHIEETLRALEDLTQSGKVRYIGASNFNADQLSESIKISIENNINQFASIQTRYSMLTRNMEDDLLPVCENSDVSILPYFPLESGFLTGKIKRGEDAKKGTRLALWKGAFTSEEWFDFIDQIEEYGKEINKSLLEISLGWVAKRKMVSSVLVGATSPEQMIENIHAISWEMSDDEMERIDQIILS